MKTNQLLCLDFLCDSCMFLADVKDQHNPFLTISFIELGNLLFIYVFHKLYLYNIKIYMNVYFALLLQPSMLVLIEKL